MCWNNARTASLDTCWTGVRSTGGSYLQYVDASVHAAVSTSLCPAPEIFTPGKCSSQIFLGELFLTHSTSLPIQRSAIENVPGEMSGRHHRDHMSNPAVVMGRRSRCRAPYVSRTHPGSFAGKSCGKSCFVELDVIIYFASSMGRTAQVGAVWNDGKGMTTKAQ